MPEAQQHPVRGIPLTLSALFFFAALDATSKHLSQKFAVPLLVTLMAGPWLGEKSGRPCSAGRWSINCPTPGQSSA